MTKRTQTKHGSATTIFQGTADMKKRQATVSPSAVPSYASACSGTARYASACSCPSITKTTVTAAQATSYVTVTAIASTVTKSTTVTSVATTSTAPAPPPLATTTITHGDRPVRGSTIQAQGPCGCEYTVSCDQKYSGGRIIATLTLLSKMDCVNVCDLYRNCLNVDYSPTTGECNVYTRAETSVTVVDDDTFAYAGTSCTGVATNPQCIPG